MQDRPEAPELLLAVAGWLMEDLLPVAPAEQRFHVRVAANACAIVAREWEADVGRAERTAQERFAREIRAGEWDARWEQALERAREEVRAKLAVAHPGWDEVADDGRNS